MKKREKDPAETAGEEKQTEAPEEKKPEAPEEKPKETPEEKQPEASEEKPPEAPEAVPEEKTAKKPKKKWKTALIFLALYALVVLAVAVLADGRHVRFYMAGAREITVECGQPYEEPGCYAVSVGRFGEGKRQLKIQVDNQVDTSQVGSYEVHYKTRYLFRDHETVRTVNVADGTPPVIQLKHTEGYQPSWLDGYQEEGYTALDACDGDLTEQVQREVLPDRIVYTVTDAAGNTASVERQPDYAVTAPTIELIGGEKLELNACQSFTDPGFTALDSQGNDLSAYVETEGEVTPYIPGLYELRYWITNALGETVEAKRTVNILPLNPPAAVQPDENTIYLTFDDGPGPYTEELLDILAAYNVKATFFVTCTNSDYEDMIGRAYREGHSIGVHSASHNYYAIYDSEEAFFDDFNEVQDLIYEQTGSYTNLLRFPGGSSNTVSSFNPGIMSRLTDAVTNMGYQYFDWNVTSGDAGETTNTNQIFQNIVDGCTGRRASIVLQHDIKDYSVAAVERVINWGIRNGYTFRALSLTSPSAHHTIFN